MCLDVCKAKLYRLSVDDDDVDEVFYMFSSFTHHKTTKTHKIKTIPIGKLENLMRIIFTHQN